MIDLHLLYYYLINLNYKMNYYEKNLNFEEKNLFYIVLLNYYYF